MDPQPFHPAVSSWFDARFGSPTEVQRRAWPAIRAGRDTLIAAPTGSGKTLAAFLAAIDGLVWRGLGCPLPDETRVLYISPLKALSNDIHRNLEEPLEGIREALLAGCGPDVPIRARVRTGDTPQKARDAMRRHPPQILVTTPESLYILLTADSGRAMLATVDTVIVDELHALAGNKRGAHLALSLERLAALTPRPPVRIGLSATQKPIAAMAAFLSGSDEPSACTIVDTGHVRERDLAIEVTDSPLEAVMANEVWGEVYGRLEELVVAHRTTLIFVNTRRLAERAAAALADRLGEEAVTAHHGSLAKEHRLDAEQRLKAGTLRALVATASLELGIDIGDIDLVCQLGSPRGIATLLQRVGRAGHRLDAIPKGRLFPLTRDDLVECSALLDAIGRGELDRIPVPDHPLDVLAQQVVAEVACREWETAALYDTVRRAWPYRDLTREKFDAVVAMLAAGYTTRRGRRGAYLHHDAVNGRLRARRGARLVAITNGGAIPDQFDYDVIMQPEGLFVGTLNEDFAFESIPGDIFQLGNTAYRMLKIEQGRVYVEDAHGQPPNIPFWFGEAPGRSDELSVAVSRLRGEFDTLLERGEDAALAHARDTLHLPVAAAAQLVRYLATARAALGLLPTRERVVFERFFDETGDMHFVIHAPYGSRVNRAWGLALRKRFCRRFNFELQAAANEDTIVLSLGPTHSFPLAEPAAYLKAATVREVLVQALLAAPMFPARWRWVANTALAVPRNRAGKKVPPPFQRNDAEDLIALVFPEQLACAENIAGDREIPDHPLVDQVLFDCLQELMDLAGLERLLTGIETGTVTVTACDLAAPSPLAEEVINARPYAFLDDTPAEERRTRAIRSRGVVDPRDAAALGRLDAAAIAQVRAEAWPEARNPDELHDALVLLGFVTETEGRRGDGHDWRPLLEPLLGTERACVMVSPDGEPLWVAAERLAALRAVLPDAPCAPPIRALPAAEGADPATALREVLRSRLEGLGPVTAAALGAPLGADAGAVATALAALEQEGFAVRGRFTGDADEEVCERRLLARIHRVTLNELRREFAPVAAADFQRFLFRWQGLDDPATGPQALQRTLRQLEGCSAPAGAWESEILPARLAPYHGSDLDRLCGAGLVAWLRLAAPATGREGRRRNPAIRSTPIAFVARASLAHWRAFAPLPERDGLGLSGPAERVLELLDTWGASFFDELRAGSGLLRSELEVALGELAAVGLVGADSFQGLRGLITPERIARRRARHGRGAGDAASGRWSLLRAVTGDAGGDAALQHVVRVLLDRYGVLFRALVEHEGGLPPWRELLYVLRRLEARGELRGGRFVQGFAGEQFALPEAAGALRKGATATPGGCLVTLGASDPLNLAVLATPGLRDALQGRQVVYRDGVAVATVRDGEVAFVAPLDADAQWQLRNDLLARHATGRYHPEPARRT